MIIKRKVLIGVAIAVIALFLVATPLGDAQHGLGRHNKILADLGQTLFVTSLVGAAVLVLLSLVALLQLGLRSRRVRD